MRICRTYTIGTDIAEGAIYYEDSPAYNDIDQDNDGVMVPAPKFMIDLTRSASLILGRQVPLMGEVFIHSVRVGIRHVDDTFDNDQSSAFAGKVEWYPPTDHNKKALGLARAVEKAREDYQIDGDSILLSTEVDYSGFRYGLTNSAEVVYPTQSDIVALDYNIVDIFDVYNDMTSPKQENALFVGRASAIGCSKMWGCSANTGQDTTNESTFTDDTLVMGHRALPIIFGSVTHSGTDEEGVNDDDYRLEVEIDFTVKGGF